MEIWSHTVRRIDALRLSGASRSGVVEWPDGSRAVWRVRGRFLAHVIWMAFDGFAVNRRLGDTRDMNALTDVFVDLLLSPQGAETVLRYDLLHVVPPQSAPDFVKRSPLADAAGRFESEPLAPGDYTVEVWAPFDNPLAVLDGWYRAGVAGNYTDDATLASLISLTGGDVVADVRLPKGLQIGGRVTRAGGVGVAGATFDIIIDAYRIELLEPRQLGAGSGMSQYGWRIGAAAAGGLALVLAVRFGWAVMEAEPLAEPTERCPQRGEDPRRGE